MGRATQGVKLIRLGENDQISSIEKIEKIDESVIPDENISTDDVNPLDSNNS
jgi:DNA gyrase subunit A